MKKQNHPKNGDATVKKELTPAMIKAMPYSERIRRYEAEKNLLLSRLRGVSAYKYSELIKEIADKWQV